ncbi:hypothetical protein J437_LFUL002195 [Ladona fulva]|uniref:Glomulin n=1 Tax=Ladona fulva TaxID=123851 RepID=A0A8K0JTM6_LADFU|nr:hypothetical protein J437_LFUL002195 [Ladona fulva]
MSSDNDCELLKVLNDHLENHRTAEALAAIKNPKFLETVRDKSWDLIPTIFKYISEDATSKSPELVLCCRELLTVVAENANPEEAILEFIEVIESTNDDILFTSVLEPLVKVHMRLPRRRGDSLKWVLNTVLDHLRRLSTPAAQFYEGPEERLLMDVDPAVVRINSLYSQISYCVKPLIDEVSSKVMNDIESIDEIKSCLTTFTLRIIGGPISFLDLSHGSKSKSDARVNAEMLMHFIACLNSNLMSFLEQVDRLQSLGIKEKDKESNKEDAECDADTDLFSMYDIPGKCFAVFYYMLLSEKVEFDRIPCVYDHFYVFQCCMYYSTTLFIANEFNIMLKGLNLAKVVIDMQMDSSISYEALDSPVHSTFQQSVINAMVYCSSLECRNLGVKVLESYIKKFDMKGKYIVLQSMLSSANHSGLAGFLLVQLKDILNHTLSCQEREKNIEYANYFSGQNLLGLILSPGGCTLSHGPETDLLEASDQILSALNLLRFLSLRDIKNSTGFWDYIPVIREKFMNPLREGIDLSRAHYVVKRKDLEMEKKVGRKKDSDQTNVSVTIGGQKIPNLPLNKKMLVVESALNTFDLIDSLLGRLNECLECYFVKNPPL